MMYYALSNSSELNLKLKLWKKDYFFSPLFWLKQPLLSNFFVWLEFYIKCGQRIYMLGDRIHGLISLNIYLSRSQKRLLLFE